MLKKIKKNERGFVILIAIMVSLILLSIGAFIASIAIREIMLSSSAKQSQAAFFAADSVLECALFKEFKKGGFSSSNYTSYDSDSSLSCNNKKFNWESSVMSGAGSDTVTHIYFVTLSPEKNASGQTVDIDTNVVDGLISKTEIEASTFTEKYPFVKLIIIKKNTAVGGVDTSIRVYGHNFRKANSIIERAIEVKY